MMALGAQRCRMETILIFIDDCVVWNWRVVRPPSSEEGRNVGCYINHRARQKEKASCGLSSIERKIRRRRAFPTVLLAQLLDTSHRFKSSARISNVTSESKSEGEEDSSSSAYSSSALLLFATLPKYPAAAPRWFLGYDFSSTEVKMWPPSP